MHLLLTDRLTCPRCGPDHGLILLAREIVDRLFDGRVQPLLQQLIDDGDLDPTQLQELRGWVDERLRDAGEDEP